MILLQNAGSALMLPTYVEMMRWYWHRNMLAGKRRMLLFSLRYVSSRIPFS